MAILVRRPKTDSDGNVLTEKVYVPLHRVLLNFDRLPFQEQVGEILKSTAEFVRITLLDSRSNTPLMWDSDDFPASFRFKVEGPGVDPHRVCRVKFPDLDCGEATVALVEIEMVVYEDENV